MDSSSATSRTDEASSPAIFLRQAHPGDEAALSLVGQASFLEAFASVLDGNDIVQHCHNQHAAEKYHAWLTDGYSVTWLAETATKAPVGYLVLTRPDLPLPEIGPTDLEVKRVYLLHRFQGGGIGGRLMNAARAHAETTGCRRLLLGVYARNDAAIGFYRRLGYSDVGTRSFKVGSNLYHDLILALALPRAGS